MTYTLQEKEPSTELNLLYSRIHEGISWLTSHDPTGAFHFWFQSGISPLAAMPAQTDERKAEYRTYHAARTLWERLWAKMRAMERKEGIQ